MQDISSLASNADFSKITFNRDALFIRDKIMIDNHDSYAASGGLALHTRTLIRTQVNKQQKSSKSLGIPQQIRINEGIERRLMVRSKAINQRSDKQLRELSEGAR
jgi:hypothetical protein